VPAPSTPRTTRPASSGRLCTQVVDDHVDEKHRKGTPVDNPGVPTGVGRIPGLLGDRLITQSH